MKTIEREWDWWAYYYRGLDVLGVDIAPSLIAHCRQKAADLGHAAGPL